MAGIFFFGTSGDVYVVLIGFCCRLQQSPLITTLLLHLLLCGL